MSMIIIIILIFPLPPPNSFLPFRMFFLAMILQNKKQESHCPYFSPSPRGWGWLIIFLWLFFLGRVGGTGGIFNKYSIVLFNHNQYLLPFLFLFVTIRTRLRVRDAVNHQCILSNEYWYHPFSLRSSALSSSFSFAFIFKTKSFVAVCVCLSECACWIMLMTERPSFIGLCVLWTVR